VNTNDTKKKERINKREEEFRIQKREEKKRNVKVWQPTQK